MPLEIDLSGSALFVHAAAMANVIGYLIRDQLVLRGWLLLGTLLYMAYYWAHPATLLWEAILWGVVMAAANLTMILIILRDRTAFWMSEQEAALYREFQPITPGAFRSLMGIAEFRTAAEGDVLSRDGEVPLTKMALDALLNRDMIEKIRSA
ncbi:MAG: hypothetical protein AAF713_02080 [Pseudomonadota bacterium]